MLDSTIVAIRLLKKHSNISYDDQTAFCDVCVISKAHQLPFLLSTTVYTQPLQLGVFLPTLLVELSLIILDDSKIGILMAFHEVLLESM